MDNTFPPKVHVLSTQLVTFIETLVILVSLPSVDSRIT